MAAAEGARSTGIVAQAKRALVLFVIVDVLIVAGVIAFYFGVSRPQQLALQRSRDRAVRATVAMETRLHAVEARAAMRTGDFAAAHEAANLAHERLVDLSRAVPQDEPAEAKEVADIAARIELARSGIDRDAEAARRDLELAEARLAALYPVSAP
jgi:hypothetical protein